MMKPMLIALIGAVYLSISITQVISQVIYIKEIFSLLQVSNNTIFQIAWQ